MTQYSNNSTLFTNKKKPYLLNFIAAYTKTFFTADILQNPICSSYRFSGKWRRCFLDCLYYKVSKKVILLVSTLDGKISALDPNIGSVIWSLDSSGPLLSSSLSSIKSAQDLVKLRFIPSLDGILFQLKGEKIEHRDISGKIQRLPDGSHVIGGKEVSLSGIDLQSGLLHYECSSVGCYPSQKQSSHIAQHDILVVRRIQQTVRAVDQRTGDERWNFSVGSLELELPETIHNHYTDSQGCHSPDDNFSTDGYTFNIGEGIISSSTASSTVQKYWTFQFKSPLAAAWRLQNNILEPLDMFKHGLLKGIEDERVYQQPLRYMGIHEGQIYIQHPPKVTLGSDLQSPNKEFSPYSKGALIIAQPFLGGWRPYISSSPSRTPSLMNDKRLSVWNNIDYPYDNGYYVVGTDKEASSTDLINLPKEHHRERKDAHWESNLTHESGKEELIASTLMDWWKEIFALASIISVCMQIVFRILRRRVKICIEHDPIEEATVVEESVSPVRRSFPSVSYSTDSGEYELAPSVNSSTDFVSRYLTDFEHQQCLGKGGFGVVFKARNRVDDCEYAVKRIQIPSCKEAREKVMREVRALAKLEHPGIVRYFHAWWESPPKGWQTKTDAEFLKEGTDDGLSAALSRDWCLQVNDSNSTTRRQRRSTTNESFSASFSSDDVLEERIEDYIEATNNSRGKGSLTSLQENDWDTFSFGKNEFQRNGDSYNDSVQIEFMDQSSTSDRITFESIGKDAQSFHLHMGEDAGSSSQDVNGVLECTNSNEDSQQKQRKTRAKYVGKCCGKSSNCIIAPPSFLYIQMQLCMQESLKEWLRRCVMDREKNRCMEIFSEIVNAVSYFHSRGMMHRDLKPSNIFFALDGKVKVGDFGLVTAITRPSDGQATVEHFGHDNHTGQVGTQLYMSPEQGEGQTCDSSTEKSDQRLKTIRGVAYNHKVDIYSLGVILLELIQVFSTEMERTSVLYKLQAGVLPKDFTEKHEKEADLVSSLVSEDPNSRLEAIEIKHKLEKDDGRFTFVSVENN